MAKNIILVGFMGTGKSAVGALVARQLHRTFLDMDHLLEERAGKPISAIFAEDGEPTFRAMERALTQELAEREDLVIATGGGIVLDPENISDFSRRGMVICLLANARTIAQRVGHSADRPLLAKATDKEQVIRDLMSRRQALYDAIPLKVDTSARAASEVAAEVIALYMGETLSAH